MQTSGPKLGSTAPTETPDTITHICSPCTPMEEIGGGDKKSPGALRPRWPCACKRCCLEQDRRQRWTSDLYNTLWHECALNHTWTHKRREKMKRMEGRRRRKERGRGKRTEPEGEGRGGERGGEKVYLNMGVLESQSFGSQNEVCFDPS